MFGRSPRHFLKWKCYWYFLFITFSIITCNWFVFRMSGFLIEALMYCCMHYFGQFEHKWKEDILKKKRRQLSECPVFLLWRPWSFNLLVGVPASFSYLVLLHEKLIWRNVKGQVCFSKNRNFLFPLPAFLTDNHLAYFYVALYHLL